MTDPKTEQAYADWLAKLRGEIITVGERQADMEARIWNDAIESAHIHLLETSYKRGTWRECVNDILSLKRKVPSA